MKGPGRVIVAIDGPAGVGKSTLARRLAVDLGLPYVNTGVMYRALTARALEQGLDVEDAVSLADLARQLRFDLDFTEIPPSVLIEGRPPPPGLVAPQVEASVSAVSRHPAVREAMAAEQRRLGADGAVVEGRDIGSVIFPDADVKVFLEAAPSERVARRSLERGAPEEAARDLKTRDALDARVNPFVAAPGAVVIDTTGKSADEVYAETIAVVRQRLGSEVDG